VKVLKYASTCSEGKNSQYENLPPDSANCQTQLHSLRLCSIQMPSLCSCLKGQQRKAYVWFFISVVGRKHALECIIHFAAILSSQYKFSYLALAAISTENIKPSLPLNPLPPALGE